MRTKKITAILIMLLLALSLPVYAEDPIAVPSDEASSALDAETLEEEGDAPDADDANEANEETIESAEEEEADAESEVPEEASEEEPAAKASRSTGEWTSEDFTYDNFDLIKRDEEGNATNYNVSLAPVSGGKNYLEETIRIVTGLSESGEKKLAQNKALVIPAQDTEGNVIQGIGKDAFKSKGLTSLTLPENVRAANNGQWYDTPATRGDFFILGGAFASNSLTELDLPEGVIYIGMTAFKSNQLERVSFPSTLMMISNQSFAMNSISDLQFTETTDFPLQVDAMAFAQNQIKEVQFPEKTEKVTNYAFLLNTGKEAVASGSTNEQKGGVVYMYIKDAGPYIDSVNKGNSNTQRLFNDKSEAPDDPYDPGGETDTGAWTAEDFTFAEYTHSGEKGQRLYGCDYSRDFTVSGIAVTGFSEQGELKLKSNTDLVIPSRDAEGNVIVGVAPGAFENKGLTSVKFPTGMLIPYNDTVTYRVTKRGNFVIGESAFANNKLKSVKLPDGVIAVMSSAFLNNEIETVTLPKTIWWVETMSFARNEIRKVYFPETTYFQFEMHGMPFADNYIKSVRLPDYTKVVNKFTFYMNPGERLLNDDELRKAFGNSYSKLTDEEKARMGLVYMFTDSVDMEDIDRIHHYDQQTASTKSYFQKLIINDGSPGSQYHDEDAWNINDFTVDGTVITGLSESGIAKRKVNKDLVIPDFNSDYDRITEIAGAPAGTAGGLFATEEEKFDTVTLPTSLEKVGAYAFRDAGLKDVAFPPDLEEIGTAAFSTNDLTSVILPDTVTMLGEGAFSTNKDLERISLSSGLTEIPTAAFGSSDTDHWMTGLTEIEFPEGITRIGDWAFAGNNFSRIIIPDGVTYIGRYAFSTKNYLLQQQDENCELRLPDGLITIGGRAFRNKNISSVYIPETVEELDVNTFEKVLSEYGDPTIPGSVQYDLITRVYLTSESQYNDREHFPESDYHRYILTNPNIWDEGDFDYENGVITGLSQMGKDKLSINGGTLELAAEDYLGDPLTSVADGAFKEKGIKHVTIPEGITSVGISAFEGNKLTMVALPSTLTSIGGSAFASNGMTSVSFSAETVSPLSVGQRAFADNLLLAVQLPKGTQQVASDAFILNRGLDNVDEGTEEEMTGGVVSLYVYEPGTEIACIANSGSNVQKLVADATMPDNSGPWYAGDFNYDETGTVITSLNDSGKLRRAVNQDMVMPDKGPGGEFITEIGDSAFAVDEKDVDVGKYDYNTEAGLNSVVFPAHLEKIGANAFIFNNIEAIAFENMESLTSIGETAFKGNKLRKVHLSDNITHLGSGAFAANSITDVRLPHNETFTVIPTGLFSMNIRMSSVEIPDSITEIGEMAFAGARLTSLEIPSSVVKIDRKAFHLHHLTELTIPGNVKEIGESAFEGTYKEQTLTTLKLEEGVESIGKYAFKEGLLTSVELPSSLKTFGDEPFLNNTGVDANNTVILIAAEADQLRFGTGARSHAVALRLTNDAIGAVSNKTYTGKNIVPAVTYKANSETVSPKAYTITYKNNKNVGTATITIVSKADPSLRVTRTFKINPKGTTVKKLTAAKKGFTVKWNKQATQTTGYQIQYGLKSNFKGAKTATITSNKTLSKKITKLKKKKKYYVRIRTYKTVGKTKYYSAWSKAKTVKIK